MAYSAGSGSDWDLIISDLAGTNSYVLDNNNLSGYASWYPDDNQMFSMAHIEGVFNIRYSIGLLSGSPSITSYVPGKYPAVSPNGNYLAYMCGENLNLCLRDLRTGSEQTLYTIEYLRINDVRMPSNPVWSADGQWIYFSSANSGDWDIYRIHSNGSGLENLTDDWGSSNELTPAYQW